MTDYFALSDAEELQHRQALLALRQAQDLDAEAFYHYDTPLTVAHERQILLQAGFARVEILKNWGATYTLKAVKMEETELRRFWKEEEELAHIHGWDFSYIEGRFWEDTDFPWDYRQVIGQYLTPDQKLLDIDTGGGEFLLSLGHPYGNTAATENYPPNVQLCKEKLLPLGIDFRQADGNGALPFGDDSFDVVIDRHGDYNPAEIYRVLKPGGVFISQQVGAENDRALVELLCGDAPMPFPEQYADKAGEAFRRVGFTLLRQEECFRPMRFYDVGALVWFARVIPWEFPDFSVDTHLEKLQNAQCVLKEKGCLEGMTHRFLLVAKKEVAE